MNENENETQEHVGHWPGQCKPGCPVFDNLPTDERAAQMTDSQMLGDLLVRMGGADYADPEQGPEPPPEDVARCPACGQLIDHCQGHGEMGDPVGFAVLAAHDEGDHSQCHPAGCEHVELHPGYEVGIEVGPDPDHPTTTAVLVTIDGVLVLSLCDPFQVRHLGEGFVQAAAALALDEIARRLGVSQGEALLRAIFTDAEED